MQIPILFMGEDFVADIDYDVTSYGHGGVAPSLSYPGDPPEPPEWDYLSIHLCRDLGGGKLGPEFLATGKLFDVLADDEKICERICEAIWESRYDDDYYD